jgi:20S proteasome subunit alpha 7
VKPFTKLQKCTSIYGHVADDSIYLTHGESTKDKEFELEMSWISTTDTNNLHQPVPKDLLDDAETQAKKEDEDEEMGDAE